MILSRSLIDGWEMRQGIHGSVIAFPVRPSDSLKKLTSSIADMLSPLAHSHNIWDASPDSKWFHVTVANRMDPLQASTVFSVLTGQQQEEVPDGNSFSVETPATVCVQQQKRARSPAGHS